MYYSESEIMKQEEKLKEKNINYVKRHLYGAPLGGRPAAPVGWSLEWIDENGDFCRIENID